MIPHGDSYTIKTLDTDRNLGSAVARVGGEYGARIKGQKGEGKFIGDGDREKAKSAYQGYIRDFEGKYPERAAKIRACDPRAVGSPGHSFPGRSLTGGNLRGRSPAYQKASRLVISPAYDTPKLQAARKMLEVALLRVFQKQREKIGLKTSDILKSYREALHKNDADPGCSWVTINGTCPQRNEFLRHGEIYQNDVGMGRWTAGEERCRPSPDPSSR